MAHIRLPLRRGIGQACGGRRSRNALTSLIDSKSIHIQPARPEQENTLSDNGYKRTSGVSSVSSPDARFEVLGAPYSLLSASLSPSQNLYTRRGTLVSLSGKADNVISTLKVLEPLRRALLQIPFLYQKISSTSPTTALISTRSPTTSFAILQLDGSVDWMVTQRQALLAWTGYSLRIRPKLNRQLSLAHWGNCEITGRGLLALVGKGQVFSIDVEAGERYVVHPSNVVAYSLSSHHPQPYRFKSTAFKLQIPDLGFTSWLKKSNFIRNMAETDTWKAAMNILHTIRTWSRTTIFGDRFEGPTRILIQTRAFRVNDVLASEEVNEIADAPPGVTKEAVHAAGERNEDVTKSEPISQAATKVPDQAEKQGFATVRQDGKVEFEEARSDAQRG